MEINSCPNCGQQLNQSVASTPPPKSWLLESILATILCCLLGVVGIVYASKVETLWYQGRHEEAFQASKNAKIWTLIALFIGVGVVLLSTLLMFLGVFAGIAEGAFDGF